MSKSSGNVERNNVPRHSSQRPCGRAVAVDRSDFRNDPVRPIKFAVAGLLLILSYGVWRLTQASSASHGGR